MLQRYCAGCHNQKLRSGGVAVDAPSLDAETGERVIAKLRARSMPPPGSPRPDPATYRAVAAALETTIDQDWAAKPNLGRASLVHRLNRTQYNNAIRDLLALDLDVKPLLPGDETADGSFDNFASSLSISTTHLERYLSVARQVTRLATGLPPSSPRVETFEVPLHVLQEDRQSPDLPIGSRGGIAVHYQFPVDGEYLIKVRLQRQYQGYLKGMGWPQTLDVRVDGRLVKRFTVGGAAKGRPAGASYAGDGEPGFAGDAEWETYMQTGGDAGLEVRVPVKAGPRVVSASFVREVWEPEGLPQPLQRGRVIANDQVYMDHANVAAIQVGGPYGATGPARDTPSRRAIFICSTENRDCAATILGRLARRAYRRPVTKADIDTLLEFFDRGRAGNGSFEGGIQFALERLLVDPDFLLRVHRERAKQDFELASRLSFFLWGSIPDERLLSQAEQGQLDVKQEARRMLADPRAVASLTGDFAAQWLNLRRLDEVVVDPIRYPSYDLSLIQAFREETERFVASTIREDRPLTELLDANYTFVNERLARHYRIPGIYGSGFRRVTVPDHVQRGGLLGQGSVLVTTSYPDRTSPVLRGKWLLNNIFGLPVPPPPPGVETNLDSKPGRAGLPIRERLAEHRQNPSCNSCHAAIDPLGFALENYDVIGAWRTRDETGKPVDAKGTTLSGTDVEGLTGLRALLLAEPELFARTVTEKLMAYALGRRVEYYDQPSIRRITREAAAQQYRWSAFILGIVETPAFTQKNP